MRHTCISHAQRHTCAGTRPRTQCADAPRTRSLSTCWMRREKSGACSGGCRPSTQTSMSASRCAGSCTPSPAPHACQSPCKRAVSSCSLRVAAASHARSPAPGHRPGRAPTAPARTPRPRPVSRLPCPTPLFYGVHARSQLRPGGEAGVLRRRERRGKGSARQRSSTRIGVTNRKPIPWPGRRSAADPAQAPA